MPSPHWLHRHTAATFWLLWQWLQQSCASSSTFCALRSYSLWVILFSWLLRHCAFLDWFIWPLNRFCHCLLFFFLFLRGKSPNLVIGPLLFNIIHSIVSTPTSYSSLHLTLVMFSLSSVHVLSLLGHKILLESSSSLSFLSLPLFNHLIYPIFITLNFHSQCHSSYLGLCDSLSGLL